MSAKKKNYGNDSIVILKGADRVRKRPAVIFGSDDLEGCKHSVFEIVSNSVDEARDGHGDKIIVTSYLDHSVEVEDFGRGCPVDFNNNEQRWNWELVYCELYAGGKYDDSDYGFSLGLNGLGACATQYASEYMDVEVIRDGFKYNLHFEKGENIGGLSKEPAKTKKTGTKTRWKPDTEVFTDIDIPADYFRSTLKKQAVVNPKVTFVLRIEKETGGFEETQYFYENGITDYLKEVVGEDNLTALQYCSCERKGRDAADRPEYKMMLSCAFTFSSKVSFQEYFHNSSFLEYDGTPQKAVRQAFRSSVDNFIKSAGKYQKNEKSIKDDDIADSLVLVSSTFSTYTSYENQTKKAINNKSIYENMVDFLKHQLEVYFIENPDDANKIADQILINKRARESSDKIRQGTKNTLTKQIDLANMVEKFVDCRTRDKSRREVYIVEGDSALGSCKTARNAEFQAIIPIRGKILNCLKADYDKIFKNDIITDLIKVLGCGVEVKSKANKDLSSFSMDNFRWNKVIICTDADYDGFQIRTLVLTMIYRLTPTLIEQGCVYIAESPLFEITTKNMTYFAYDEKEKTDILAKIGNEKYKLDRSKGLGENDPEMMALTTMNPETRRLIKITPTDAEETAKMFDLFLGNDLEGRKDYIAENGSAYLEMADIS
ncbi:MAG: toprim domain-containing protein [Oscillospiraceae bacterium]|nr:toprim domain-containing protein [Oscillospiraceae bacterium]